MSVFTNNLSDSFATSDALFKGAINLAKFVDTLGAPVVTSNALGTEDGNTLATSFGGTLSTDSQVTQDSVSILTGIVLSRTFTENLETIASLIPTKSENPVSNNIVRVRTVKNLPVNPYVKWIRNRTIQSVTIPNTQQYLRNRQNNVTAGTFSYLHSGFLITQTESLTGFLATPSYNYKYTRAIVSTVINPRPTGDVIGSELGDVISDEVGNAIGSEELIFNDLVASSTITHSGSSNIYFSSLSETLPIIAFATGRVPLSNRKITENLSTTDILSSQVICNRKEIDGTAFTLQTESGSGIYTNTASGITVSSIHTYDTVSYVKAKVRSLSDSLTTSDSLSVVVIIHHNIYPVSVSDGTIYTLQTESGSGIYTNTANGIVISGVHTTDAISKRVFNFRFQTDTTHVIDSVIGYTTKYYLTDSLSTSDSISASRQYTRSLSDTLITYPVLTRVYPASISETLTTNDSNSYSIIRIRQLANVTATQTSDSLSQSISYTRQLSDSVLTSSNVSSGNNHFYLSDNLTLLDAIAGVRFYSRSISETTILTDSITSVKYFVYTTRANEVLTVSDSLTYTISRAYLANFSENIPTSSSLFSKITRGRNPFENILTSDTLSAYQSVSRLETENFTTTDALSDFSIHTYNPRDDISGFFNNRVGRIRSNTSNITETTQVVDSVARGNVTNYRTVNESLNTSDSLSQSVTLYRRAQNTNRGSQTLISGQQYTTSLASTLITSDAVSYSQPVTRYIADTLKIVDARLNKRLIYTRNIAETFTTFDTAVIKLSNQKFKLSDTFLGSQQLTYTRNFTSSLADSNPTLSASITSLTIPTNYIRETLNTSASVSYNIKPAHQLVDYLFTYVAVLTRTIPAINLSDTFITFDKVERGNSSVIRETLRVSDVVSYVIFSPLKANLQETLITTDSVQTQFKSYSVSLSDNLPRLSDAVYIRVHTPIIVNLIDTLPTSLTLSAVFLPRNFFFQESLLLTDSVSHQVVATRSEVYTSTFSESVTSKAYFSYKINESVATSDNLNQASFVTRTPSDASFESEVVTHKAIVFRTISDSLQTLDSVARSVNYFRINQDNFNTTSNVARSIVAYRTEYYIAVRNDTSVVREVTINRNVASSFTSTDLNSRFVGAPRVLRDDSSTNDSNARFVTAPRNPIVDLPTIVKLTRFVTESRSLMDASTTFDASIYFIARQALLQDATAVLDAINRATFYTRRPLDISVFIDTPKPNTIKYRQTHDLTGITEYVVWRHPFIFSNKIFESYKTRSSLNYEFKIIEILLPIELYSNVLFENNGVVGKGRIVSIKNDTYIIAPYAGTIAKGENFYVVPKANVALLPPNYR